MPTSSTMTGASTLDPELAEVWPRFPDGVDPGAHLRDMNVVRMLRSTIDMLAAMGASLPDDERVGVEDRSIPGPEPGTEIPVRVYTPVDARRRSRAGRWCSSTVVRSCIGDRYTEELRCLRYAAETPLRRGVDRLPARPRAPLPGRRRRLLRRARVDGGECRRARQSTRAASAWAGAAPAARWRRPSP